METKLCLIESKAHKLDEMEMKIEDLRKYGDKIDYIEHKLHGLHSPGMSKEKGSAKGRYSVTVERKGETIAGFSGTTGGQGHSDGGMMSSQVGDKIDAIATRIASMRNDSGKVSHLQEKTDN